MWTGNEVELLTSHGFAYRSLDSPKIGDVLWRKGHTEIYLGDGMQGGARHGDYAGGLDGRQGDQDGTEVTRSKYRASDWTILLRYEGDHTCDGIPAAIVAAKVADHIIDHEAHGYSQPHRAGDGTVESVTITWDGTEDSEVFEVSTTVTFGKDQAIRDSPSLKGKRVGTYAKGESVTLSGLTIREQRVWGCYVGRTSGKVRYVCVASCDGRLA